MGEGRGVRELLLLENSHRLQKLRLLQKFPNSLEKIFGRWSRRLTRVDSVPVVRSRYSRINASTVVVVITANVSTAESNGSLKRKDEHKGRRISFDCCNRNRSEVERERFFILHQRTLLNDNLCISACNLAAVVVALLSCVLRPAPSKSEHDNNEAKQGGPR